MVKLTDYIANLPEFLLNFTPWQLSQQSKDIIWSLLDKLPDEYFIKEGIAIHHHAVVEEGAILKAPCIIGAGSFIAAYAYLRDGVWLDEKVTIGPASEIKSSFLCSSSKAAHFNFIGNSIIGREVNIEAGAIIANYRNELENKEIVCLNNGQIIKTNVDKFGALIGDHSKIGANAVLAPGTLLSPNTIVPRLALIDQLGEQRI